MRVQFILSTGQQHGAKSDVDNAERAETYRTLFQQFKKGNENDYYR